MSIAERTGASGSGEDVRQPPDSLTMPFMHKLTSDELEALTSEQTDFIMSLRPLQTDPNWMTVNLKRAIADMSPPARLFSKGISDLPFAYFALRDLLDKRGANLPQHSFHRIVLTLAHGLYEEQEDTHAAVEIAKDIVAAGRRGRTDLTNPAQTTPAAAATRPTTSTEKTAHSVGMRLRDND